MISTETLSEKIDSLSNTLKKCNIEPENTNSFVNKFKLQQYARSGLSKQKYLGSHNFACGSQNKCSKIYKFYFYLSFNGLNFSKNARENFLAQVCAR